MSECNTCRFARWHGVPDLECRRRSPETRDKPGYGTMQEAVWPPVKTEDWCGEYVFGGEKHTNYGPPNFGEDSPIASPYKKEQTNG